MPTKLHRLPEGRGQARRPYRFRLRVLGKRFGDAFTATKLSPQHQPARAPARPAAPARRSTRLRQRQDPQRRRRRRRQRQASDAAEAGLKTDPCKARQRRRRRLRRVRGRVRAGPQPSRAALPGQASLPERARRHRRRRRLRRRRPVARRGVHAVALHHPGQPAADLLRRRPGHQHGGPSTPANGSPLDMDGNGFARRRRQGRRRRRPGQLGRVARPPHPGAGGHRRSRARSPSPAAPGPR